MDSAKMCGFLATSCVLLLTLLGDPTEACSCAPSHPQTAYCNADVVIRCKFVGNGTRSGLSVQYEIKTTKVYKGSEAMQELRFLHTPAMASVCGYEHKENHQGEEYVIAGMLDNNLVRISACSFIQPWAQLTPEQRRGLSLDYSKGCSCQIVPCYSMPCSVDSNSQCLWTDGIVNQMWNGGSQDKSAACLPKSGNPGLCTWQSLKSEKSGFLRKARLRQ
ncbi:metalloproteinase inhibitor 1 [Tiliqua scincoides]|uniref:metalloproteinase inhibitor 1 n=1 Tax=Tiliqua scincoides TaxID=71010 RepID=UPI003462D8A1